METALTKRALEFATEKHSGQTRKNSGAPYISHPIAVANIAVSDIARLQAISCKLDLEIIAIVALLHDVLEDTDATDLSIRELFKDQSSGFIRKILDALDALTKRKDETYLESIKRVMDNRIARIVKKADLTHNMSDLKPGAQKDKYRLALFILELSFIDLHPDSNSII